MNISEKLCIFRRSSGDNAVGRGRMWVRTKKCRFYGGGFVDSFALKTAGRKIENKYPKNRCRGNYQLFTYFGK